MGRGRGKGKRQSAAASQEDHGSGEEEKIPVSNRRGRPTKPLKDDIDDEEEEETETIEEDGSGPKDAVSQKDVKHEAATENGRKRKRVGHAKVIDSAKEESGNKPKSMADDLTKNAGFRQNGSRRKNKPRRAAEAGVECK